MSFVISAESFWGTPKYTCPPAIIYIPTAIKHNPTNILIQGSSEVMKIPPLDTINPVIPKTTINPTPRAVETRRELII